MKRRRIQRNKQLLSQVSVIVCFVRAWFLKKKKNYVTSVRRQSRETWMKRRTETSTWWESPQNPQGDKRYNIYIYITKWKRDPMSDGMWGEKEKAARSGSGAASLWTSLWVSLWCVEEVGCPPFSQPVSGRFPAPWKRRTSAGGGQSQRLIWSSWDFISARTKTFTVFRLSINNGG